MLALGSPCKLNDRPKRRGSPESGAHWCALISQVPPRSLNVLPFFGTQMFLPCGSSHERHEQLPGCSPRLQRRRSTTHLPPSSGTLLACQHPQPFRSRCTHFFHKHKVFSDETGTDEWQGWQIYTVLAAQGQSLYAHSATASLLLTSIQAE